MMKNARFLSVLAVLMVVGAFLAAAPAAACCTPCGKWCQDVPPSTYCCTGIPEPGNACGLTTCGKFLESRRTDAEVASFLAADADAAALKCSDFTQIDDCLLAAIPCDWDIQANKCVPRPPADDDEGTDALVAHCAPQPAG